MTCRCGASFCWGCGRTYESYVDHEHCPVDDDKTSQHRFEHVQLVDVIKGKQVMKEDWYLRCIDLRFQRDVQKLRQIEKKLGSYRKDFKKSEQPDTSDKMEAEQMKEIEATFNSFKGRVVQALKQVSFFMEYTWVWIYLLKLSKDIVQPITTASDQLQFAAKLLTEESCSGGTDIEKLRVKLEACETKLLAFVRTVETARERRNRDKKPE